MKTEYNFGEFLKTCFVIIQLTPTGNTPPKYFVIELIRSRRGKLSGVY
jgi:hypothetical protein